MVVEFVRASSTRGEDYSSAVSGYPLNCLCMNHGGGQTNRLTRFRSPIFGPIAAGEPGKRDLILLQGGEQFPARGEQGQPYVEIAFAGVVLPPDAARKIMRDTDG